LKIKCITINLEEKMDKYFQKVKGYLLELDYIIVSDDENDGVFVIEKEEAGIKNMVLACAEPILVMEQSLFSVAKDDVAIFKSLLIKNRDIIHGAFALDEAGKNVIFRDTLALENLDLNELESSLNSLSLLLSEYSGEIIEFSAQK